MMDIIEAMKERRSVRSFDGEALSDQMRHRLTEFIDNIYNPFDGHFSIGLKQFDLKNGYKPSTYGVIKGANDFFTIAMGDDEQSALAVGFGFEQVVLRAWQIGLGTCWIAATFKGTDFERDLDLPAGETLKIVSPVGVAAKKSVMERITRAIARSDNRKPFGELFFADSFAQPLQPGGRFGEALEMLRLAPSSTNSQPWRALVQDDTVHFYYQPKSSLSVLDCGIGLCHFYETEKHRGRTGAFYRAIAPLDHPTWRYLLSYKTL